jgi:hypothetical protein
MKLGTSQPGSVAPALVAFLVLAGSAALAATQGPPSGTTARPSPEVSHVQAGRLGHQTDEAPEDEERSVRRRTEPAVEQAGCDEALADGGAALERAHGLDRAIQAILDRCGRGSATHGLLNALEHLHENRARHAEHQNQGKSDKEHGKPADDPGKTGEEHGQSDEVHGNDASDAGGGTQSEPPGGGPDEVGEDDPGPPNGHGPGDH